MFRNTELGGLFSTLIQRQVKRGLFSSEHALFRGHFSIALAVFRGGLQISSSRMGRQLSRELSPRDPAMCRDLYKQIQSTMPIVLYSTCKVCIDSVTMPSGSKKNISFLAFKNTPNYEIYTKTTQRNKIRGRK